MPKLHSFQVRTGAGALIIVIVGSIIALVLFKNIDGFHKIIDQFDFRKTAVEKMTK